MVNKIVMVPVLMELVVWRGLKTKKKTSKDFTNHSGDRTILYEEEIIVYSKEGQEMERGVRKPV